MQAFYDLVNQSICKGRVDICHILYSYFSYLLDEFQYDEFIDII